MKSTRITLVLVVILIIVGLIIYLIVGQFSDTVKSGSTNTNPNSPTEQRNGGNVQQNENNPYPTSGDQVIATMNSPAKAYFDGTTTEIMDGKSAKYVFEADPSIFFICGKKAYADEKYVTEWKNLPSGNYLIYPYPDGTQSIKITWKKVQ